MSGSFAYSSVLEVPCRIRIWRFSLKLSLHMRSSQNNIEVRNLSQENLLEWSKSFLVFFYRC